MSETLSSAHIAKNPLIGWLVFVSKIFYRFNFKHTNLLDKMSRCERDLKDRLLFHSSSQLLWSTKKNLRCCFETFKLTANCV